MKKTRKLDHPDAILYGSGPVPPIVPVCDHYAGFEKFIVKAVEMQKRLGPVFDITCDLEDGAEAGSELNCAGLFGDIIGSSVNPFGRMGIRIHDPKGDLWEKELKIILPKCGKVISHITIPKANSLTDILKVEAKLSEIELDLGLRRKIPMNVLIESPGALIDARYIAKIPRVQVLDFGLMDFVSSFNGSLSAACMRSPMQFEHHIIVKAKTEIVFAALSAGKIPSHNVTTNFRNIEAVKADAGVAASKFGFARMWSVHPTQIEPIIEAFTPTKADVNDAVGLIELAIQSNWGPLEYKGALHDRASFRYSWSVIKKAKLGGISITSPVILKYFS